MSQNDLSRAHKKRWRYKELIQKLGGPEEIRRVIKAQGGNPPPIETIRGWRLRNSIPGDWLPFLLIEAQQLGLVSDLRELGAA